MLENKKRNHHYVFQAYLKNWSNQDEKIWCLRDNKTIHVKTKNIAFKKDLYRVYPLNESEIELIKLLFSKRSKTFKDEMEHFLDLYTTIDRHEKVGLDINNILDILNIGNDSEITDAFAEFDKLIDVSRNNFIEEIYCDFEGEASNWIRQLINMDTTFLNDSKAEFIAFVCSQYFRTKRMRDHMVMTLKKAEVLFPTKKINAENIVQPILWLLSSSVADALINSQITLLINKTNTPFITTDQPVINTKADYHDLSKQPDELILYYPISPEIALLINDDSYGDQFEINDLKIVNEYNKLMYNAAYDCVFSNNKESLENIKNALL